MSPAKLRMAGLGTAVAVAVLLPIVAVAGPSGPGKPSGDSVRNSADGKSGTPEAGKSGDGKGLLSDVGDELGLRKPKAPAESGDESEPGDESESGVSRTAKPLTPPATPDRTTRCGPELASPEGIEAQTCVLAEGPDVWARTYYRNATGQELDAFLTLLAPGGRTVQTRCAVTAQDEPGTCETPRERRGGGSGASASYTAVAEFAGSGEGDNTPLLLRSGSNTADAEGS